MADRSPAPAGSYGADAAESCACPKCDERSAKGQFSQTDFHCPRRTFERAHLEVPSNGMVCEMLGWLSPPASYCRSAAP